MVKTRRNAGRWIAVVVALTDILIACVLMTVQWIAKGDFGLDT